MDEQRDGKSVRIEVPGATFAKAAVAVVLIVIALWAIRTLSSILLLIALSLIVAGMLSGIVSWLQRRGLGRGLASVLALMVAVIVIAGVLAMVLPPLVIETIEFVNNLPEIAAQVEARLRPYPDLRVAIENRIDELRRDPWDLVGGVVQAGRDALGVVIGGVLLLTPDLYFLIDVERDRGAVHRLTPPRYRDRVGATIDAAGSTVRAYFIGQAIVSTLFAAYTFLLLTILGVPYAIVMAALGFVLDAIPNIGSLLATIIPALLALTISPVVAAITVGAFLVYQQIENNLISPRVIGNRLNIPPVMTMIAVLVGGRLMGVIGIFIAIPIAGMMPSFERIWIRGDTEEQAAEQEHESPRDDDG